MVYLLYDCILLLAALVLIPCYYFRGVKYRSFRQGIKERLGFFAPGRLDCLAGRRVFWIHAVSVGETRAALPLVKALKKEYPQAALVISNVTETGHEIAFQVAEADCCLFFPYDFSPVVRRVLRRIRPALIVIVETEIWPNFIRLANESGIPVVLVNGRISDRSYPRYQWIKMFIRPVLQQFSRFCMQTAEDARRLRMLGAPVGKVRISGNVKFDLDIPLPDDDDAARLRKRFHLPGAELVWVAGSTHAGEEEAVVDVYQRLAGEETRLRLVLVPRHPERCSGVGKMLAERGIPFVRRCELTAAAPPVAAGTVLLVDTVGELQQLCAVADLVFVGGSLVPVGGHNVLEASAVRRPVIFGPYMHNFREISQLLLAAGGGIMVADAGELLEVVRQLVGSGKKRQALGNAGYELIDKNRGATAFTLEMIRDVLAGGDPEQWENRRKATVT
jgi:3-deoxy-D-manno-octulosonic-acid transferase